MTNQTLILARLNRRGAFGRGLRGFLQKSLDLLALLEALETIQHTRALKDLPHGFGRQSAVLHPMIDAVLLDVQSGRLGARIIESQNFKEAAIARRFFISGDDAIRGLTL